MNFNEIWPPILASLIPPLMMLKAYRQLHNMADGFANKHGKSLNGIMDRFYKIFLVRISILLVFISLECLFFTLYFGKFAISVSYITIYVGCFAIFSVGVSAFLWELMALYKRIKGDQSR